MFDRRISASDEERKGEKGDKRLHRYNSGMEVKKLLAYADWSKDLLRSTVEKYPDVWNRKFETTSNFKSIYALTAHIAAAEERLQMRIFGQPRPEPGFEDRCGESIAEVFAGWDDFRSTTHQFVSTATAEDLAALHHLSFPQAGLDVHRSVEDLLFHVFNHQTYHIGQISTTLQRWGIEPPNFDFLLMPDL